MLTHTYRALPSIDKSRRFSLYMLQEQSIASSMQRIPLLNVLCHMISIVFGQPQSLRDLLAIQLERNTLFVRSSNEGCRELVRTFAVRNSRTLLCQGNHQEVLKEAVTSWRAQDCKELGMFHQNNCDATFFCKILDGYKGCSKQFLEHHIVGEYLM